MSNYRAPLRDIKVDWRYGETDPMMAMRVDAKAYLSGARSMKNMMLHFSGGASRRPGTRNVVTLPERVRLLEFEFDFNERYVIGFANGNIYAWTDAGAPCTITPNTGPWNATTIWELNIIQKLDVMIVVHPSFKMRRLRRTGLTTFALEVLNFSTDAGENVINQPYLRRAPSTAYTIALSAWTIGTGRTLTSNFAFLNNTWIGERIRVWNKEMTITAVPATAPAFAATATVTVNQTVKAELAPAPFRVELGDSLVEVTHVNHGIVGSLSTTATVLIDNAVDLFGIPAANLNGTRTIGIIDTDHYRFNAGVLATGGGDGGGANVTVQPVSPTMITDWAEQVWSNRRGWPGAITLHENRIWMGGSTGAPTFIGGSAVGDYFDFNVRDGLDDESVQGTISALSRIVHLVSHKQLQIFCETSEAVVETQNGEPITPGSMKVINHTAYGADPNVRPRVFDGATIFAQRNGKNIRELIYDFNTDAQVAPPISILASHMIDTPNDAAVLLGTPTRPEQYAFFVNYKAGSAVDGTIACFHSIRSEEFTGWTRFVTGGGGRFDSVCVVGSKVFFSVLRSGVYYLERLELDATDIWLDGAKSLSGASSVTWALGAAYANKTVHVMSNGYSLGQYTANASGAITLLSPVTAIIAGYDYGVELIPNPPDKEMTDGSMTGEKRRITSSNLHFHQSVSAAVNGKEQLGFVIGQDPSLPPVRITGKRRIRHLGYGTDPTIVITQPNPGPLIVLGMIHEVSI